MERRLAAILKADVAGYTRLMRLDEMHTVRTMNDHRAAMGGLVADFRGQVANMAGDSFLAEFPSVTDAVDCAIAIQDALATRNAGQAEDRQVRFRIGLNLGDVIHDAGDIHGDGINVAARIEALAEAGGICLSATIYEQISDRPGLALEDLGEHAVKNVSRPVRIYRLGRGPAVEAETTRAAAEPAPSETTSQGKPTPAIIVLPFANLSGDAEQEYFSDGITEDIITELSRLQAVSVIARNTSFSYRGRDVNLGELGRELGVRYALEGSVRRAGNRVRVSAELAETDGGNQLWAERFDRELDDVFAVQDEITQHIVAVLTSRLELAELERARRKTRNMAAYDYVLRGKYHHHRFTPEDNAQALELLDKAIALDPSYAPAHAWRACTVGQAWVRGYLEPDFAWNNCVSSARAAMALDDDDHECHRILSDVHLLQGEFDRAEFHQDRAIALNPNDPRIISQRGELLTWLGRAKEGIPWLERALKIDPYRPDGRWSNLGTALFVAKRYADAAAAFAKIANPGPGHHAYLAACHARLGDPDAARAATERVLAERPDFSVDAYLAKLPYKDPADRARHRESLEMAGLPG